MLLTLIFTASSHSHLFLFTHHKGWEALSCNQRADSKPPANTLQTTSGQQISEEETSSLRNKQKKKSVQERPEADFKALIPKVKLSRSSHYAHV